MNALLDSQREAIARLIDLKVGANFAEPGTGKTRSTMELIKSTPTDLVVWITPFQTKDNLLAEIAKWGGLGDRQLHVVGTETISSSDRTFLNLTNLLKSHRAFIVVDESLKIKNWDAKRTQRIIEMGKLSEYKMILNGTPISRNILDVWAQMEFLSPLILNMSQAEYKNTFCEYTKISKRIAGKWVSREFITKFHNVDYLYSIIEPYIFECDLKMEVGKQYIDVPYKLCDQTRAEYQLLKEKYLDDQTLQWKNNNIFLEMTQKMQHVYCCTAEKFEALDRILKDCDRSKVLIYRKFVESEIELTKRYPDIEVLSIQSHAYGLNKQEYNTIIGWDKVWDYALLDQRDHRVYRTGQTQDCRFIDLTGDVGLEDMMNKNVAKKGEILKYFKQHGFEKLMELL